MEGSATYIGHYFYSQHPDAGDDWLYQQADRGFWTDYNGSGLGDITGGAGSSSTAAPRL